jgi:hypothetical protein
MRIAAALLTALACVGCVTETPLDIRTDLPPTIQQLRTEIDSQPACGQQGSDFHIAPRVFDYPVPAPTARCVVVFPETMRRARIEAICIAMFDLDPAGSPRDIFTTCNVGHASRELTAGWKDVATQGFNHAAARIAQRQGYPAENATAAAGKWRTNLSLAIEFRIPGEIAPIQWPRPFERAAPAPAMTPEQFEYHRDPMAWVCKRGGCPAPPPGNSVRPPPPQIPSYRAPSAVPPASSSTQPTTSN